MLRHFAVHLQPHHAAEFPLPHALFNGLQQIVRFQFRTILAPGRSPLSLAEHQAIVAAIAAGDRKAAEKAMRRHLDKVAQWHSSDDNYAAARAVIVNAHHQLPMAALWDNGTTSSSAGQYFRAGGRAGSGGAVNAKYGIDPGFVLYTLLQGDAETQSITTSNSPSRFILRSS